MKDEEIAANKCCCRSHLVVAVAIAWSNMKSTRYDKFAWHEMRSLLPSAQRGIGGRRRHCAMRYVMKWGTRAHFLLAVRRCFRATRYEGRGTCCQQCCSCSQFVVVVAMIATRYEMLLPSSNTIW